MPGMGGLLTFQPATARHISELMHVLLHGPGTLTLGERELIGTFVSSRNGCRYCTRIHGAVAAEHLGDPSVVEQVKADPESAPISAKMKALLGVAARVREGGQQVTNDDVNRARQEGATDEELHDTVLIAAAFCMVNRYLDGLGVVTPDDPEFYRRRAAVLARDGYLPPSRPGPVTP
jgi:uncharacterized peroxidase-related enzyme